MAPEVLIVGDATRRADLLARVEVLGYDAAVVGRSALEQRIARGQVPGAVVVCAEDVDARGLMVALRGTRRGSGVPVTLYGPLSGATGDLADVLDMGADHFLEAPATDQALAAALEELLGPGGPAVSSPGHAGAVAPRRREPSDASVEERTGGTEAVLGQLHRTLDLLEARLRERDDDEADDLDLDALGLPPVEQERGGTFGGPPDPATPPELLAPEAGAAARLDLPLARTEAALRSGSGGAHARGRREPTERLGDDDGPRHGTGARIDDATAVAASEERPRRHAPLPIDERGPLDRVEVPRLLWLLHRARFDGVLVLERGTTCERVWWRDGELVHASSSHGPQRFVDELLHRGLITRDRRDVAGRLVAEEPGNAGARLVRAGLLDASELPAAFRDHLTGLVGATFGWPDGQWELVRDEAPEGAGLADAPVVLVLAHGVRQRLSSARLTTWLDGADRCPRLRQEAMVLGGPSHLAERLRLRPSEEAWLPRLDGTTPLRELLARPGTDEHELLALVYLLHVIEHLELLDAPLVSPPHVDPVALATARIRDRLRLAREGDYFAALGLPRDAEALEVRRAHADVSRTFADPELPPAVRTELRAELDELRDLLDEARDVLVDEGLRSAYLAYLEEP
ncbi:DUF4388 domain-containing protein [Paraliomyxa miuraensis]|uniref:DUF4388 domain-containing protein n=1 Tax=Paraliomyxa miuraensis TaxID=376150 RepID=UPI00224DEA31|nr:DUF4388 domain-containing protein [Paraliomyxa miuraensis]MCX4241312.1 DUF4388 domain-containing protein [Paraliomyxa miuraensis]